MGEFFDMFVPRPISFVCAHLFVKAQVSMVAIHIVSDVFPKMLIVYQCTYYMLGWGGPVSFLLMRGLRVKERALKYVKKIKEKKDD
jgi:uncharacterized membrane protein